MIFRNTWVLRKLLHLCETCLNKNSMQREKVKNSAMSAKSTRFPIPDILTYLVMQDDEALFTHVLSPSHRMSLFHQQSNLGEDKNMGRTKTKRKHCQNVLVLS